MSYTALIFMRGGKPDTEIEFRNSWGGAARIWTALFDKYLKDPEKEYDSWIHEKRAEQLWKLVDDERLSLAERIVLAFTFDYAMVRSENFKRFAADLREFERLYPREKGVNHLPLWARAFEEEATAEAIGLYGTSCSENPWWTLDEEDEDVPYDLATGDRHFEVYEKFGAQTNEAR